MKDKAHKIVITGYPYSYPYYFKVFEYFKDKQDVIFLLPKHWEAKKGKVKIDFKEHPDFEGFGLGVASYGGKSTLAGLFKGWMPGLGYILPFLRLKYGSGVLYSCSEPNLLTTLYNGFFAKILGFKHVLFTWQNVPPEKRMSGLKLKLSNFIVWLNLFLSDGVICGNKKSADIIRKLEIRNSKLEILVCPLSGVDTERFRPRVGDAGGDGNEKIVLFYGALEKRKGVDVLIEAFSLLMTNDKFPMTKLLIIGTGPEKENLESRVKSLELGDRVIFKDWMKNEELPEILRQAWVFVYPSLPSGGWEEQFGYAMGEASASEIPVIASRTGSIEEVVVDGQTGILFESGNTKELSSALEKILKNGELRQQMGRAGREYIEKNFSHKAIADQFLGFFKIIGGLN